MSEVTREDVRKMIEHEGRWGADGLKKFLTGEQPGFAPGLAGIIFHLDLVRTYAENTIHYALRDFFERGGAAFKRFDYYDASIEFWAKPDTELTEEEQRILSAFGFDRCWVCWTKNIEADDIDQCGEKYYGFRPR